MKLMIKNLDKPLKIKVASIPDRYDIQYISLKYEEYFKRKDIYSSRFRIFF